MKLDKDIVKVKNLMTKKLITIQSNESVIGLAKIMAEKNISSVLIEFNGKIDGIVTDRDIIRKVVALGLDPRKVMATDVSNSPLIIISEDASVEEAATKMRDNKVRRLVVKNRKEIVGIITETDIIRVDPELHFLIRERSRLKIMSPTTNEFKEISLSGNCEDCENYSNDLVNVDGRWLCEECRT